MSIASPTTGLDAVIFEAGYPRPRPVSTRTDRTFRRRLAFACLTVGLGTAVLGLAVEVVVRTFFPQVIAPVMWTDSGLGIRVHAPNVSIHHTSPDYHNAIRTNTMGFRSDSEYSLVKPDGVVRIVGIGDSFAFGYGVEAKDTYLARLGRGLQDQGIDAEVLNLGQPGFGTAEELVLLRERGLSFDPDIVILQYFRNDVGDSARSGLYALSSESELYRTGNDYLPGVRLAGRLNYLPGYRYLAEHSQSLTVLRRAVSAVMLTPLSEQGQTPVTTASCGILPVPLVEDVPPSKSPVGRASGSPERLTAALLDEIKRVCDQRGIAFILLEIPSQYLRSDLPRAHLSRITQSEIVDMGPHLAAKTTQRPFYWKNSWDHWTPAGHELAANALGQEILPVAQRIARLSRDLKDSQQNRSAKRNSTKSPTFPSKLPTSRRSTAGSS